MKKIVLTISAFLILLIFSPIVYADNNNDNSATEEITSSIDNTLEEYIPDTAKEYLEDNEISSGDSTGVSSISVWSVIKSVLSEFGRQIIKPLTMLGKLISICVLCVLAKTMCPEKSGMTRVFATVGILASVTVIYDTIYGSLLTVTQCLSDISTFMIGYIPIFSSITTAGGNAVASTGYYGATFALCELITLLSDKIMLPFLSIVFAISLVSAINPELRFSSIAGSIKKAVQWLLGGIMTIFVGLISIQGIAGASVDTVAGRTAKFAASSFIPIIGGSVSEAYSTVYGSLGIIRSGVGVIGIIVIAIIVLQPIIILISIKLVVALGKIINELFDQKESAELLNNTNSILSVALSIVICISLIFIISTAIILLTAMNTGA